MAGLGFGSSIRRAKPAGTNDTTYTSATAVVLLLRTTWRSWPWSTNVEPLDDPGPKSSGVQSGAW